MSTPYKCHITLIIFFNPYCLLKYCMIYLQVAQLAWIACYKTISCFHFSKKLNKENQSSRALLMECLTWYTICFVGKMKFLKFSILSNSTNGHVEPKMRIFQATVTKLSSISVIIHTHLSSKLSHNINNKNGAFYACVLPIFFFLLFINIF